MGIQLMYSSQAEFSGPFFALWGPEQYTSCWSLFPDPALIDTNPDFFTHQVWAQKSNKSEWSEKPGMCSFVVWEFLKLTMTLGAWWLSTCNHGMPIRRKTWPGTTMVGLLECHVSSLSKIDNICYLSLCLLCLNSSPINSQIAFLIVILFFREEKTFFTELLHFPK